MRRYNSSAYKLELQSHHKIPPRTNPKNNHINYELHSQQEQIQEQMSAHRTERRNFAAKDSQ